MLYDVLNARLRQKERLIADAKAEGKTTDEAVASTEDAVTKDQLAAIEGQDGTETRRAELRMLKDFESSIETGFQMATFQGPLCSEPVVGMAWTVESIEYHKGDDEAESGE